MLHKINSNCNFALKYKTVVFNINTAKRVSNNVDNFLLIVQKYSKQISMQH